MCGILQTTAELILLISCNDNSYLDGRAVIM
jgi:hypothetical protein